MEINVKFMGLASIVLDKNHETIQLAEGKKVRDVLILLKEKAKMAGVNADATLDYATFLVNKKKADINTELQDGDELMIMKSLGGG